MTTRASVTSLEFYRVTITPSPDDDPTGLPVRFAFPVSGGPPVTWYAAQWEAGGPPYVARLLIGPDGTAELAVGAYDVYVEVEEDPETVRFLADRLVVFSDLGAFATVSELADLMRTDIDPEDAQANQSLTLATELIRSYTRQTLTEVVDDEATLEANWRDSLVLPEVPVSDVTEVVVIDADQTETTVDTADYYLDNYGILRFVPFSSTATVWPWPSSWWWGRTRVRVTYTHGYATLPEGIRQACLQVAARLYQSATNVGGGVLTATAETIGGYQHSEQYDAATATTTDVSTGGLTADEMSLLSRYRTVAAA